MTFRVFLFSLKFRTRKKSYSYSGDFRGKITINLYYHPDPDLIKKS